MPKYIIEIYAQVSKTYEIESPCPPDEEWASEAISTGNASVKLVGTDTHDFEVTSIEEE